jgi:ComF family protein
MKHAWQAWFRPFAALFDILLPERTRAARIRTRRITDFPLVPAPHELLGERITTLLDYKDAGVTDLVRALKYEHSGHAANLCAEVLVDYLQEELAGIRAFSPRPVLLVPVPLHPQRQRSRGFNQMEKVLKRLPAEYRDGRLSTCGFAVIVRKRPTAQQTRLSRQERLANVAGAFAANSDAVQGTHVILVDDVTTTGATLASAAQPLRECGAQVTLIALARA